MFNQDYRISHGSFSKIRKYNSLYEFVRPKLPYNFYMPDENVEEYTLKNEVEQQVNLLIQERQFLFNGRTSSGEYIYVIATYKGYNYKGTKNIEQNEYDFLFFDRNFINVYTPIFLVKLKKDVLEYVSIEVPIKRSVDILDYEFSFVVTEAGTCYTLNRNNIISDNISFFEHLKDVGKMVFTNDSEQVSKVTEFRDIHEIEYKVTPESSFSYFISLTVKLNGWRHGFEEYTIEGSFFIFTKKWNIVSLRHNTIVGP